MNGEKATLQEQADALLMRAATPDEIRECGQAGANPNVQAYDGSTLLMRAFRPATANALLDIGADPDLTDLLGKTALHRISSESHHLKCLIQSAEAILKRGANPNIRDMLGETPMHSLSDIGSELGRILHRHGADLMATNATGSRAWQQWLASMPVNSDERADVLRTILETVNPNMIVQIPDYAGDSQQIIQFRANFNAKTELPAWASADCAGDAAVYAAHPATELSTAWIDRIKFDDVRSLYMVEYQRKMKFTTSQTCIKRNKAGDGSMRSGLGSLPGPSDAGTRTKTGTIR